MEIRRRIINACQELARTRGFRSMTVDEIAQNAGVSKKTIYRRFQSKDEILEAAVEDFLNDISREADLLLSSGKDIQVIIQEIIYHLMSSSKSLLTHRIMEDLSQYYPHLWQKIDRFRMERIKMMIKLAESQRAFKSDIDPLILSAMLAASIQAVINPNFIIENNLNFEEVIQQVISVFMPALSSPTNSSE